MTWEKIKVQIRLVTLVLPGAIVKLPEGEKENGQQGTGLI